MRISTKRHLLLTSQLLKQYGVGYASLFREKAYVGGNWVQAESGDELTVTNPANGVVIGKVPDMGIADTQAAIDQAYSAFQTWKKTTAKERSSILRRWFNLMEEHKEELSVLLCSESGKPLAEAQGEIGYGNAFLEFFAEEAKRVHGEIVPAATTNKEMMFVRHPIGVAGLITPWNFPNAMIARKAAAAMAAGCACVVKPAEDTPFSALAMAELAHEAGVPPGVFNVVTSSRSNTPAVGNLLCTSSKVAGISFTGSTAVGKLLYKQCSSGVKRISLELGGNAPFIVFGSADVAAAVEGLMVAKFRNTGQTCISANRIFVHSDVYDEFVEGVVNTMKVSLKCGNGIEKGVTQGPLINPSQFNKVKQIVEDSVNKGAKILLGGKAHSLGRTFYEPTVLTNVTSDMPCYEQEIFGPVVAIRKFETEEEVLSLANDCNVGLAGYFYSRDVSQVFRVSRALEVGMIGINEGLISAAEGAFGGIKESGFGREGSSHGIDDFTYIKYLCIGGINN